MRAWSVKSTWSTIASESSGKFPNIKSMHLDDVGLNRVGDWTLYMLLHIRLRIRHWSNLSEFSICIRLSALNHSANNFRTSQKCPQGKEAGTYFASGQAGIETCSFVFRFSCPSKKPIRRNNAIIATHCHVSFFRSWLTTQAFFFVDWQLSYSSLSHANSVLAANDCIVILTFQVKSFLQHSSSSSLASASRVQHDNESWHARQCAFLTITCNLNLYGSRTRAWADVFTQRKPYHNIARWSPLIFSIFLHQISCTSAQSISETTSQNTHLHVAGHQAWSPRLAPQCLAFP